MISADKIYAELLELYHNSGREFYAEMAALLGQQTDGMEHSFLTREDERWKIIASTVKNRDEREFLRRQADTLEDVTSRDFFSFPQQRAVVRTHLVIPLRVRKRFIRTIWIVESRIRERIPEREIIRIARLIALFFQLSKTERNWYMDPGTGLPGRTYFTQILAKLLDGGHKISVCVFRIDRYRERVQENGSLEMEREYRKMIEQIKQLQLGNLYAVADDTAAVISLIEEKEAYARTESILDRSDRRILAAIIHPTKDEDIFAVMENRLSVCNRTETRGNSEGKTDEENGGTREEETSDAFSLEELLSVVQEE